MANFKFYRDLTGNNRAPVVYRLPVAASQDISAGDLLVVGTNQVEIAGTSLADPVGVAMVDSASAAADTLIEVQLILPGFSWRATADADASGIILSRNVDINADQTVDVADTTNGCISVMGTIDSSTDIEITFTEYFFVDG